MRPEWTQAKRERVEKKIRPLGINWVDLEEKSVTATITENKTKIALKRQIN
jgi:hypothetical protein